MLSNSRRRKSPMRNTSSSCARLARCRLRSGHDPNFNHPEQPVAGVSWHEATRYCEWLSTQTGRALPPAHRGRMGIRCPRRPGAEAISLGRRASAVSSGLLRRAGRPARSRVAQYAPNAFGLYDIGDNVHEWCSDWYDPNYYAIVARSQPARPGTKSDEACRANPPAEAPGATTSKSHAAPRVRAFPRSFSTRTMGSESPAIEQSEIEQLGN